MADIRATQSGAFEVGSTWVGGVVPGSGDMAFANTFTITISDTRQVQAISNASGTGITVGGTFSLLNGCNLTCTNAIGVVQGATATSCITTPSLGVGSSASVAAAIAHGVATSSSTVFFSTTGTLSITGTISGPTAGNTSNSILASGAGTLNVTGSVTGGSAGANNHALNIVGATTVNITGNITGGGNSNAFGMAISTASANVTVTGNVTGGSAGAGINNNAAAIVTVNGTCQSSATAPAIGGGALSQITRLSGPLRLGVSGNVNHVQAQSWRWAPTLIPTFMEIAQSNGTTLRLLYSADNMPSGGYPVAGDVRQFTVYGPNDEFDGTLAVAPLSSVAAGVSQDNGVGTAVLTAANVQAALTAQGLTTTRAGYLDNLSAAPPNAATIAAAVWAAADKTGYSLTSTERQAIATAVEQSILNESDGQAILNAIVGAIGNTNVDQVALIAAIRADIERSGGMLSGRSTLTATQVWGNTTRTITGGTVDTLVNAPTVPSKEAIATQVRTELAPELDRLKNCSTVDTTATAIQDAVSN
jgi:hypothetical protein